MLIVISTTGFKDDAVQVNGGQREGIAAMIFRADSMVMDGQAD
jgi:hypothetical protein